MSSVLYFHRRKSLFLTSEIFLLYFSFFWFLARSNKISRKSQGVENALHTCVRGKNASKCKRDVEEKNFKKPNTFLCFFPPKATWLFFKAQKKCLWLGLQNYYGMHFIYKIITNGVFVETLLYTELESADF